MKTRMKELFSFTIKETDHSKNKTNKIELVSCPLRDVICKGHLNEVNNNYLQSEQYHREKEFKKSIETLKSAFYKTTELVEHPCANCVQLFRSTIFKSMENIHGELETMSKGFFGSKRYQSSYISADNALREFGNMIH